MHRDRGCSLKGPTLLVLAAGMGNRYGGLKQMDRLGMSGEVLLDYSVYDAIVAGFSKVVFVIRQSMEEDFSGLILSRLKAFIDVDVAYQELNSCLPAKNGNAGNDLAGIIAARVKPWGTAHAVLCARQLIREPFAVINADDFYGRKAFKSMSEFLMASTSDSGDDSAIVPYPLRHTLSVSGSVSRGVCRIEDRYLVSVTEHTSIQSEDRRIVSREADGKIHELDPDTPVSMNYWGFKPSVFPLLEEYFSSFLAEKCDDPKAECYLPAAVDHFIAQNLLRIRCLELADGWFGVTYKEDRDLAVKKIEAFIKEGVYPSTLWNRK